MRYQTAARADWQGQGGTVDIPDGCFVCGANFDSPDPYIMITDEETGKETRIDIPKCLAYYLSIHSCGSSAMKELIEFGEQRRIIGVIKTVLSL